MSFLLDGAYLLLGLLASPFILFKIASSARWRAGFRERLGFVRKREGAKPCVWIHAVSVGELNAARTFIDLILKEAPEWDARISTTTDTGQKLARERYGAERCFYFPLDLSFIVRRAFQRVRPDIVVLMELEIWPNFCRLARQRRIPLMVINGRMREKWVNIYRLLRFLYAPAFDPASGNLFCVQNDVYRDRFERVGIPTTMVRVTGNIKYDAVRTSVEPQRLAELCQAFELGPGDPVWVAGCTWPGEEAICLRVHRELQREMPSLRLIVAPRHIERADEVAREVEAAGFGCRRRTSGGGPAGAQPVCLLDTVGELGYTYGLAQVAFVGKSLTERGGHNVLEPAALAVMPVFGPLTDNFRDEVDLLLAAGAAERVADEKGLAQVVKQLLRDPTGRRQRSNRGRDALLQHCGASRRCMDVLRQVWMEAPRTRD